MNTNEPFNPQDEEFTLTPGGFAQIEMELDNDLIETLVDLWVDTNLSPASIEQYFVARKTTTQAEALLNAVANEQIVTALQAQLGPKDPNEIVKNSE